MGGDNLEFPGWVSDLGVLNRGGADKKCYCPLDGARIVMKANFQCFDNVLFDQT